MMGHLQNRWQGLGNGERRILKVVVYLVTGFVVIGLIGYFTHPHSGPNPNQVACHEYYQVKSDADAGNYVAGANEVTTLESATGSVTNAHLKKSLQSFEFFFNNQDAANASSASYLVAGTCDGLGYSR